MDVSEGHGLRDDGVASHNLGALVRVTGLLEFDNVRDELRATFGNRFKASVVEGNIRALERAYEEVVSE